MSDTIQRQSKYSLQLMILNVHELSYGEHVITYGVRV